MSNKKKKIQKKNTLEQFRGIKRKLEKTVT